MASPERVQREVNALKRGAGAVAENVDPDRDQFSGSRFPGRRRRIQSPRGLGAHGQHHRRTVDSGDSHGHGRPVLVGYGNSTQAGSSHLEDQLPLMTQETLHRIWREKKDIEANLENRESF